MSNALKIAAPPPRPAAQKTEPTPAPVEAAARNAAPASRPETVARPRAAPGVKFGQAKEDEIVQFNKRVSRRTAEGFEILAIRSRKKMAVLMAEALDLLEQRYGRVS
jgi:hypothetical protein